MDKSRDCFEGRAARLFRSSLHGPSTACLDHEQVSRPLLPASRSPLGALPFVLLLLAPQPVSHHGHRPRHLLAHALLHQPVADVPPLARLHLLSHTPHTNPTALSALLLALLAQDPLTARASRHGRCRPSHRTMQKRGPRGHQPLSTYHEEPSVTALLPLAVTPISSCSALAYAWPTHTHRGVVRHHARRPEPCLWRVTQEVVGDVDVHEGLVQACRP